ncbi:hypothetical protein [Actinoplanes utahensis]|uniref:hypothetical protein n=1 Tax=Actinoplanes utahensis TaxID=1869 RepID=UPI001269ECD5|nr:hypothetical protein [Actinoplanes utahensis]GIF27198.1 hypothetical protein Aut01nite_01840 [Actinoplanes utahensis]
MLAFGALSQATPPSASTPPAVTLLVALREPAIRTAPPRRRPEPAGPPNGRPCPGPAGRVARRAGGGQLAAGGELERHPGGQGQHGCRRPDQRQIESTAETPAQEHLCDDQQPEQNDHRRDPGGRPARCRPAAGDLLLEGPLFDGEQVVESGEDAAVGHVQQARGVPPVGGGRHRCGILAVLRVGLLDQRGVRGQLPPHELDAQGDAVTRDAVHGERGEALAGEGDLVLIALAGTGQAGRPAPEAADGGLVGRHERGMRGEDVLKGRHRVGRDPLGGGTGEPRTPSPDGLAFAVLLPDPP